jgi:hypothetical protein
MAKKKTWILVADGARARIFINEGPGTGLRGLAGADYEADHRPTHEIGVERPGRTQESLGDGTRHAYAPRVDWHEYEKHLFAKEMARVIDQACEPSMRSFWSLRPGRWASSGPRSARTRSPRSRPSSTRTWSTRPNTTCPGILPRRSRFSRPGSLSLSGRAPV